MGKNFAISMIKHVCSRQINLAQAIRLFEDRFLDTADQDFLLMIVESMMKGKQVHVTKAVKPVQMTPETPDGSAQSKGILSVKDKENILNIFEILGGMHNRQQVEKVFLQNNKDFDRTLDMFLSGAVKADDQEAELRVVIEEKKENSKVQKIDTSKHEIQADKKRQDLKQYLMKEYSNILGVQGVDQNKLKGNKFYQNHLRALELQRQQEQEESKELKIKIMAQAEAMQYDDDFDEEEHYANKKTLKYKVETVTQKPTKKTPGKQTEDFAPLDDLSEIPAASTVTDPAQEEPEEDEDMLDDIDKFLEAQDSKVLENHDQMFEATDKIAKIKKQRLSQYSKDGGPAEEAKHPSERQERPERKQPVRVVHDEDRRGGRGRGERDRGGRDEYRGGRGRGNRPDGDRRPPRDTRDGGGKKEYKEKDPPQEEIDPWKYDADVTNRAPRDARPAGLRGNRGGDRGGRGRGRGEGRGDGRGGYRDDF